MRWFSKRKLLTLEQQKQKLQRNKLVIYVCLLLWIILALVVLATKNQVAFNVLNIICFVLLLTIALLVTKNLFLVYKIKRGKRERGKNG